jgi:hypothetical protein
MPALFALTLFVSAALLFWVQPMIAKMILPLLGGTPAVWNTCMVFFQAVLLAGYAYAHATTAWLGVRRQVVLHLALLCSPFLVLPVGLAAGWVPPSDHNPIPWLLALLAVSVGLPFFVLSASAPLLQTWFAGTGHRSAGDPYFLYAASNLGSMLALLGYPLVLEPFLSLKPDRWLSQNWLWTAGYALLVALMAGCALAVWLAPRGVKRKEGGGAAQAPGELSGPITLLPPPRALARLRWVALAFVPSSLLLGVTTYITTDIAPVPLLWVIPLALYLLSFILVFARRPLLPPTWAARALPMAVLGTAFTFFFEAVPKVGLPLHLLTFFLAALVCHGELARDRPPPRYLTGFYLCISVGGVLGGLANALVAPLVFDRIAEYPLALVLLCLLRPAGRPADSGGWRSRCLDVGLPLALGGAVAAGLVLGLPAAGLKPVPVTITLASLPLLLACYAFKDRPLRFALGVAVLLLTAGLSGRLYDPVLYRERTFFGALRVTHDLEGNCHQFAHGSTLHGKQSLDPERRREPLTYYYRTGPVGRVFKAFQRSPASPSVAVVGLGAGSLACYAKADEEWTFFEIDPAVERIARDPRFFTFLQDCRAGDLDVLLGDARLRLQEAPARHYGLIVLDAFSSDSIPVHLLTREALRLYLDKLADGGILAIHASNLYLDLRPVLGELARDAHLACRVCDDTAISEEDARRGKTASRWVVMARRDEDLGSLASDPRWQSLSGDTGGAVWTDDFSNIATLLSWK